MFLGYLSLEQIDETSYSMIYQAIRKQNGLAVIIKLIKQEYPTLETIHRYQQEDEIINYLEHFGIIKNYEFVCKSN